MQNQQIHEVGRAQQAPLLRNIHRIAAPGLNASGTTPSIAGEGYHIPDVLFLLKPVKKQYIAIPNTWVHLFAFHDSDPEDKAQQQPAR